MSVNPLRELRLVAAVSALVVACGGSDDESPPPPAAAGGGPQADSGTDGSKPPGPPPAVATESPYCVLNLDCPAGQYCDLGACTQACNVEVPCPEGTRCSARGRCLAPEQPEQVAPPSGVHEGELEVEPLSVQLDPAATEFQVRLTAAGTQSVRYRVETSSPHLVAKNAKGEFSGSTALAFEVDPSMLQGPDAAGTLRIFTTLGNVSVNTTLHRGLTGYYRGVLRYEGGPIALGDSDIALDLREESGEVTIRIDPDVSPLFPRTGGQAASDGVPVTGRGTYADERINVTVVQRVDAGLAGKRNVLARDVSRKLQLALSWRAGGTLEGDFSEQDDGLLDRPVKLNGSLILHPVAQHPVAEFTVPAPAAAVPSAPTQFSTPQEVFGWSGNCSTVSASACSLLPSDVQDACRQNPVRYADQLTDALTLPLVGSLSRAPSELAPACESALAQRSVDEYRANATAQKCGLAVPLGCLMQGLAQGSGDPIAIGRSYSVMASRFVAPTQVVVKERIVKAALDSFSTGAVVAASTYDQALERLTPAARWMMQAPVLNYLRDMPVQSARGVDGDPLLSGFPAARALVDIVSTRTMLEVELARASNVTPGSDGERVRRTLQEGALLAHLQAAALGSAFDAWDGAPAYLPTALSGAHSSYGRAFSSLGQGQEIFGAPVGFVPFLFRPEDAAKGPTNFEQVFFESARTVGDASAAIEAFRTHDRAYEQNQDTLRAELVNVRVQYDASIKEICGSAFDPDQVSASQIAAQCGAGDSGTIASLRTAHDLARAQLSSHLSRMEGKQRQIAISVRAMNTVYGLREDEINFVGVTGRTINALTFSQGLLQTVLDVLSISAEGELFNGFSGLILAVPTAIVGTAKAALELSKNELALLQTMRAQQTAADIEQISAFAVIQRELIELGQMRVEVIEGELRVHQALVDAQNALVRARELTTLRAAAIDAGNRSSAHDPSFRLLRDQYAIRALRARDDAQRSLFLAARALEYEMNMSLNDLEGAVVGATTESALQSLSSCMQSIFAQYRLAYGSPQEYVTTVSVRKLLGIEGDRTDQVTGQVLSPGEQFRQLLLRNENLDGRGGVRLRFATTLQPNNGLWSDGVCNDRVSSIQAQLVGDFLGDNQAEVDVVLDGTSLMRSCDSEELRSWSLGGTAANSQAGVAVVQAGSNSFGDAPPNTALFGQSVARATWQVLIPGGAAAPANSDVDIERLEDVVLKLAHKAVARRQGTISIDLSCVGDR